MARGVNLLPRLLVLWLLAELPQHGYSIKRALRGPAMAYWFPIDDASIYNALRTLVAQGWATEQATERDGARPPRTRYAITRAGRAEYARLLTQALAQPETPHGLFPIALAARADLDNTTFQDGLVTRVAALESRLAHIAEHARDTPSALLVDRERALLTAEIAWCRGVLQQKKAHSS
jgi:DNA-binding PadR family transcriptional regulator